MNRTFSVLLITLLLTSCEDSVKFEEPQPSDQSDLKRIPKKLRGSYFSTSDGTYLTINDKVIIDWTKVEYKTLIDSLELEIDSTKIEKQTNGFVNVVDGKYTLDIKFFGDSVLVNYSYHDTLFEISDRNILRRFNGHYFLNYKRSETHWKVRRLTLNKKELAFSKVRVPNDMTSLKQITEVEEVRSNNKKVVGYRINPSRKELKQLMKHSFSETKTYSSLH